MPDNSKRILENKSLPDKEKTAEFNGRIYPEASGWNTLLSSGFLSGLLLIILGAAGMFFGQPNNWLHLPALVLLYPFSLFLLAVRARRLKDCLIRSYLLGLAAHSVTLYWLVHPMHDVAGLPYAAAAVCVVLLSCYLALYSLMAAYGMRGLVRLFCRISEGLNAGIFLLPLCALLCGIVFGGFEVLSGWLFTGFPWLSLSSAFALTPLWVQTASITGSYGLSALYAATACLCAAAFIAPEKAQKMLLGVLALVLFAAQPLYGMSRLETDDSSAAGTEFSLVMVQGNIDQNQKWVASFQKGTLDKYLELSTKALQDIDSVSKGAARPALVLWPETALPFYFQLHREYSAEVYAFALKNNINLMFGTLGIADDGRGMNALFNRLYLVSHQGSIAGWYDKKHLVPFGEYIPFAADIAFLRKLLQGVDFAPGTQNKSLVMSFPSPVRDPLADAPIPPPVNGSPQAFSHTDKLPDQTLSLGALICYEAIFPYLAQQRVAEGAVVLVNVSNDAWFQKSSAPLQHLSLTAMRAVEQARPIVRCTNTGITAIIDARGRVRAYADKLFESGALTGSVRSSTETTLFHLFFPAQEYFLLIMAILSLLCHHLCKASRVSRDTHVPAK